MPEIKPYTISRDFKVSRELLFKVQTEPAHLLKWMGSPGSTAIKSECDFRVGGLHHYGYKMPDGTEMWGKQIYREIKVNEKVVLVQSFSDKDGGLTRHPMAPVWPLEMLATSTFEDLGNGMTRLTITWLPINASDAEKAAFDGARAGMDGGFGGMFQNLETYLASIQ